MFLFGFCSSRVCGESTNNPRVNKRGEVLDPNSSKKIIKKIKKASKVLKGFKNFEESIRIQENDF